MRKRGPPASYIAAAAAELDDGLGNMKTFSALACLSLRQVLAQKNPKSQSGQQYVESRT